MEGRPEPEFTRNFTAQLTPIRNDIARILAESISGQPTHDHHPDQYHPEHCLFTTHRREMYYAFEFGGAHALALYLKNRATQLANDPGEKAHSGYFAKDADNELPLMIMTMHPEVVKALICGNLTYRMKTEPAFAAEVGPSTQFRTYIGIYYNQWYDIGKHGKDASQPPTGREGMGFSAKDLERILELTELYADRNKPGSLDYAKKVDRQFGHAMENKNIDYKANPDGRKYLANDEQEKKLQKWRSTVQDKIVTRAAKYPQLYDVPCQWSSLCSVGIGVNCLTRSKDHVDNQGTSSIFGLLNAIIHVEWGTRFEINQVQLLYIVKQEHCDLAEAFLSVVASSYHDYGGLNGVRAGGAGYDAKEPTLAKAGYTVNAQLLFSSRNPYVSGFEYGLEHQRQRARLLEEYSEGMKQGSAADIEKETQRLKDDADEKYEEYMTHMESLDALLVKLNLKDAGVEFADQQEIAADD